MILFATDFERGNLRKYFVAFLVVQGQLSDDDVCLTISRIPCILRIAEDK